MGIEKVITLEQIANAQNAYMRKWGKIPTRIIMNPVGAQRLNTYLRDKMLEEIETPEIRAEILSRWREFVQEGDKVRGLEIRYAFHYQEDYFEVCD